MSCCNSLSKVSHCRFPNRLTAVMSGIRHLRLMPVTDRTVIWEQWMRAVLCRA